MQQWMPDAKYAPLSDSSSDSDSDSDSDESMDGRRQLTPRSKMELTEVFTWMTVWVMIIFAVYSSEVRCACASVASGASCRAQIACTLCSLRTAPSCGIMRNHCSSSFPSRSGAASFHSNALVLPI